MDKNIICKVCNYGGMYRTKIHRLSGPLVVIGYLILVPSGIALAISVFLFVYTACAMTTMKESPITAAREKRLRELEVPEHIIQDLSRGIRIADSEIARLPEGQRKEVQSAIENREIDATARAAGTTIGFGLLFCLGSPFLIGCIIGWLLTMKKTVLLCNHCGATFNAV